MQDLKPIRTFLEVAERQSFSAAAKALGLTPASVTRIVAKLEEDLGRQLLLRTTRQVSMTSAGALVAARYRPLVAAFDQAGEDLSREMMSHRGRLSINAPMSFGLRVMPGLVEAFRLAYPNIDLNIQMTDRLVDVVAERCDLAIRVSRPPQDKSTIWRKLCEVPMRAVAAPALFDRAPRPQSPDDLDPALCLSYGAGEAPEVWRFEKGGLKRPVTAGQGVHTNNGDLLYQLALSGAGIVVLPGFHADEGVKAGLIEEVLPDWTLPPLWLSLFYPPYEALPPLVATFAEFFEGFLGDEAGFEF
ncbi:LysR family transcriptional regulator [Pacificoceanicola onchidii]|uniref:LysR family transcriptional regulator n=1 Tax=Pacificoceanicola onchidii TaxID=2562685 RepID=UPI0010A5C9FF|nr:LysR family transcriptional regulator [Pacificoceanicola onchidii]